MPKPLSGEPLPPTSLKRSNACITKLIILFTSVRKHDHVTNFSYLNTNKSSISPLSFITAMSQQKSPEPLGTTSLPPISRAAATAMGRLFVPDPDSPINHHLWSQEATHNPGESEEERQTLPHAKSKWKRAFGEKNKRKAPNDDHDPAQGSGEDAADPVTQNELEKYTNAKNRDRRGSKNQRQAWPQLESLVSYTAVQLKLVLMS
jgi:hypothetical protein